MDTLTNLKEEITRLTDFLEDNTSKTKVTINYNSEEEAKLALNARAYKIALEEVWERVFRPNYKHGYGDKFLDSEESYIAIDKLADIFNEIKTELYDNIADDEC